MSEWSSKERALLDAAKKDWGPSAATASAVREAVAKRIAEPGPGGADESGPAPTSPGPGTIGIKTMLGLGVAVVGLAVIGLWANGDRERTVLPSSRPQPVVIEAPAPSALAPSPAPVEAVSIDSLPNAIEPPRVRSASSASAPVAPPADTLAEELALLRTAQSSLHAGAPGDALVTLQSHASKFPRGVLREERMTLQVLALCDTGKTDAARAMRAELERTAPGSSHLNRLATSCAAP